MKLPVPFKYICSLLGVAASMAIWVSASEPEWWLERGVIATQPVTGTPLPASDYAAVNTGQLKNFAQKARLELIENLPGGSGTVLDALIASFDQTSTPRADYAAVNVGQLKAVAKPFYDRLIEEGYTAVYPWPTSSSNAGDYAMVNIGQVKTFSVLIDSRFR